MGTSENLRSDTHWIGQLRTGSHEAVEAIFDRYLGKVQRLASRRLSKVNCREADEEDVAISALYSFFRGFAANRFPDLTDRDDLWRLLAVITARKAVQQTRRQYRIKRGANSVRGESIFVRNDDHVGGLAEAVAARECRDVELRELVTVLIDSLGCEKLQQIALLKLQGETTREIAEAVGCTTRTVERKVNRIREAWHRCGFADD